MAKSSGGKTESQVREFALTFPEAYEEFPWGHSAIKVKGKAFLFMGTDESGVFSISMKLPQSRDIALDLPFTEPTGYGMGKSGWVTATIKPKDRAPHDLLQAWIRESYRAIAPKTLVKMLDGAPAAGPKKPAGRKAAPSKEAGPAIAGPRAAQPAAKKPAAKNSASKKAAPSANRK